MELPKLCIYNPLIHKILYMFFFPIFNCLWAEQDANFKLLFVWNDKI
jgi:hypothetical protein